MFFLWLIIVIFSAAAHEFMHGFVADKLGDPTARLMGRLTLNPLKHFDLYYSFLLPILLFFSTNGGFIMGGAKPVPVDPYNLQDGRKDLALVSLAGPLTNVIIAIVAAIFVHLTPEIGPNGLTVVHFLCIAIAEVNLQLAIFNLLPIPPLDGSKIFSLILPEELAQRFMSLNSYMMLIVLAILFLTPIGTPIFAVLGHIYTWAAGLLGL